MIEEDNLPKEKAQIEQSDMDLEGEEEILDFTDVKPFEPLDSRVVYKARVDNLEIKTASTGKKMAVADFVILAPEEVQAEVWEENDNGDLVFKSFDGNVVKAAGRHLFRNFTLESQALPFLYNFLKACDPDVVLTEAFRFHPMEWIGRELAVKGTNSAYEEQVRLQPNKTYPVTRYKE